MNCGIIRRMRLTIIIFSLFFNLCPFYLFAQTTNLRSRTLTVSNRLSNLEVTSILQDKKGFIWIGTNSGLNRYDGYFVKNKKYTVSATNISLYEIGENNLLTRIAFKASSIAWPVFDLKQDFKERIWVTHSGGICLFKENRCE